MPEEAYDLAGFAPPTGQTPGAALTITCMKKISGTTRCGLLVAQGKYCPDHTCTRAGCSKPKGKKATFCKIHAPNDTGTTPVLDTT